MLVYCKVVAIINISGDKLKSISTNEQLYPYPFNTVLEEMAKEIKDNFKVPILLVLH